MLSTSFLLCSETWAGLKEPDWTLLAIWDKDRTFHASAMFL